MSDTQASLTWAAFKLQVHTPAFSRVTRVGTNDRDRVINPGDSEGVWIRGFSTEPVVAVNDGGARMAGLNREKFSNNRTWSNRNS